MIEYAGQQIMFTESKIEGKPEHLFACDDCGYQFEVAMSGLTVSPHRDPRKSAIVLCLEHAKNCSGAPQEFAQPELEEKEKEPATLPERPPEEPMHNED